MHIRGEKKNLQNWGFFYIFAPGTGCLASFPLEQHFLLIWHYSGGFFFQCFCLCGKLWYSGNFQSWAFNISPSATKKSYFRLWFKLCGNKLFLNVQQRLLPLYRFQKAARRHISAWNPWDHRVLHLSTGWDEKWECYSSTQTASSWILSTYTHTSTYFILFTCNAALTQWTFHKHKTASFKKTVIIPVSFS